jgi:hypothetical protein
MMIPPPPPLPQEYLLTLQLDLGEEEEEKKPDAGHSVHTKLPEETAHKQPSRCKWCQLTTDHKSASVTWYHCTDCKPPVALCRSGSCYANWHNEAKVTKQQKAQKERRLIKRQHKDRAKRRQQNNLPNID